MDNLNEDEELIKGSLKSIFKYPLCISKLETGIISNVFSETDFFKKEGFKFNLKNILFNGTILKSEQISFSNDNFFKKELKKTIHYETKIQEEKLELFLSNINDKLIDKSFSIYKNIKHILEDYNMLYDINFIFIDVLEKSKDINYNTSYNLRLFDIEIEINDSNAFKHIEINIKNLINNLKIKLKVNKDIDISDFFSFILKEITLNFSNYHIPENMNAEAFNEFLINNHSDIDKINKMLNY